MSVHRIHPHVINNNSTPNNSNNDILNNLNNLFDTNNNENTTANFSSTGQQINSVQFREIVKLIIHILKGFLHISEIPNRASKDKSQHQSLFKRIINYFKK